MIVGCWLDFWKISSVWRHIEHALQIQEEECVMVTADELPAVLNEYGTDIEMILFSGNQMHQNNLMPKMRETGAKLCYLYCSSIAQCDTSNEWGYILNFYDQLDKGEFDYLMVGEPWAKQVLNHEIAEKVKFMPQCYDLARFDYTKEGTIQDSFGLMSDIHAGRKNTGNQIAAIAQMQQIVPEIEMHCKNLRFNHEIWADMVDCKYTEYGWFPEHSDFMKTLSSMNVGMEVTMNEAFNFIAAEYMLFEIPVVIGPSVFWGPDFYRVKNPEDIGEITDKGLELLEAPYSQILAAKQIAIEKIEEYNAIGRQTFHEVLNG